VDRRETDASKLIVLCSQTAPETMLYYIYKHNCVPYVLVWLATQNHSDFVSDRTAVPFLPVNPSYSSTRNQGRQKLALFNAQEFSTLVLDIVIDARRREMGSQLDLNDGMKAWIVK
jgi:hypothetical protein